MIGAPATFAVAAIDQRIVEGFFVPGVAPGQAIHENSGVQPLHIIAFIHIRAPPGSDDIVLQFDAERPPIEDALQSAIDFGTGKHKAAPLTERHQLIQSCCWHIHDSCSTKTPGEHRRLGTHCMATRGSTPVTAHGVRPMRSLAGKTAPQRPSSHSCRRASTLPGSLSAVYASTPLVQRRMLYFSSGTSARSLKTPLTSLRAAQHARVGAPRCVIDMGIDLRRRNRRVPQQFLHFAQIGSGIEHMHGKRMPQHMRCEIAQPQFLGILFEDQPEACRVRRLPR